MKLIRIFFSLFFLITFFSSCGKKNEDEKKSALANSDIISRAEMAGTLEDIYLAEGAVNLKEINANNPKYFARRYYDYVLKKHNLTADEFMKNYVYYSSDADEMIKIVDLIITDLSQKQGVLQGTKDKADVAK
jgi:hypothetical protein